MSKIGARLERLESRIGTVPDLVGEAARYGTRVWSALGFRAYAEDSRHGARLTVVGPAGTVTYQVVGVTLGALS